MSSFATIILLFFILVIKQSQQEYFTALVHLEKLLKTEQHVVESLNRYLDYEEKRLASLRQLAHHYNALNLVANQDIESYLSNPVNAYLLVKRLTTDWNLVEYLIEADRKDLIHLLQENETFPSAEDLSGAAEALLRLQDTYKLDTTMLADGVIPIRSEIQELKPDQYLQPANTLAMPLTANDCFELGRQAYHNKDYQHTVLWMKEALRRLDDEYNDIRMTDRSYFSDRSNMLEHLAFASYQLGSLQEAYDYTLKLLDINPEHERARSNLEFFNNELNISNRLRRIRKGDTNDPDIPDENSVRESSWPLEEDERDTYEALCRGENRMSESIRSQLKCFFLDVTNLDPYIRLWRIKVEEAYKRPNLVIFIDFMSNYEIEIVKSLSEPKLKRATVQNYFTGKLETAKYRISKSAWLTNRDHEVVYRISRRIQAITGLEMETAEELQVVNYGIGGHYEPHFDFARREEPEAFKSLGTGNRIATWLNYMSDVQAGGATVFPHLGVTLWPRKNAAAFWYNLYKSSEGDLLTRHAACPVLVGSKWVSNKWIHEIGQEFRKPCGLNQNELNIIQHVK